MAGAAINSLPDNNAKVSMSYVVAVPEALAAAAGDAGRVAAAITEANSAAAAPTTAVLAAGADEVSTAIASAFSAHAQAYQSLSAAASAFHAQFVRALAAAGARYASAEATNASPRLVSRKHGIGLPRCGGTVRILRIPSVQLGAGWSAWLLVPQRP